jgi:hypothetical protein
MRGGALMSCISEIYVIVVTSTLPRIIVVPKTIASDAKTPEIGQPDGNIQETVDQLNMAVGPNTTAQNTG